MNIDKSQWPDGPWKTECDQLTFITNNGLEASIKRHTSLGFLMGAVGIPQTHKYFKCILPNLAIDDFEVHGGIQDYFMSNAEFGESPNLWYLSFYCNTTKDYVPLTVIREENISLNDYRTIEYVKDQCEQLAQQLIIKNN